MKRSLLYISAASAAALVAGDALASGILVARFGGEHGHPTANNPTVIYYNPAALTLGKGLRLMIDGSLAWRSFTYDRDEGAIDTLLAADGTAGGTERVAGTPGPGHPAGNGIPANSGEGTLFNVLTSPFFGAAYDFGVEGLGVGVGFYVPFGGQSKWDEQDAIAGFPGAEDGAQRWWVIEGTIRSLYITGAAAYEIPKTGLSIGLGLNAVKSEINTVRARVSGTAGDHLVRPDGSVAEGRAWVDVSSWDVAMSAGLLYQPLDNLWFGFSWQSQPGFGQNELEGQGKFTTFTGGAVNVEKFDARVQQEMPDVFRLGARWRPTQDWEVRLFGDYARWSVFTEQPVFNDTAGSTFATVDRDWHDATGVRAGGSYFLNQDIELYLGAGFDQNAVPDSTVEPALYDANKVSASLGARFEFLDDMLGLAATYTQVFYFDRDISPRRRLPCPADDVRMCPVDYAAADVDPNFGSPDSAGKYSQAVGVLNINLEAKFF